MSERGPIRYWLSDMDGVLVHEGRPIPGAGEFVRRLRASGRPFLVLTNNSIYTRRDLSARLARSGLSVPPEAIWTSALATAQFLSDQRPEGSAYVTGEAGLTTALHEAGYVMTDTDPDYVVLGETRTYSFSQITRAIRLIEGGARFIATNPDPVGPSAEGSLPACGAVAAMITRATGVDPYFVGKPNPLMMRTALNRVGGHSESTAMIGDRMDTDVVAGVEAGLETILVLTGVTGKEQVERFPFRPSHVLPSIADVLPMIGDAPDAPDAPMPPMAPMARGAERVRTGSPSGPPSPSGGEVRTIAAGGSHELVVRKSRFACTLEPVPGADEAAAFLDAHRRAHRDASHNCTAYVVGERGEITRSSDDGEPAGTAGVPMLRVLTGRGLTGVAAVVTRHFGGVKLGTGGLARAYAQVVGEAVDAVGVVRLRAAVAVTVRVPHAVAGRFLGDLHGAGHVPDTVDHLEGGGGGMRVRVVVPADEVDGFEGWAARATGGRARLERGPAAPVRAPATP